MKIEKHIDGLIEKTITLLVKNVEIPDKKLPVLKFGFRLTINTILAYSFIFIPAILLGISKEVLLITLPFAILRGFSGGAHNSNIMYCSINGAFLSNLLGIFAKHIYFNDYFTLTLFVVTFVFSLWSIGKYAPADTPGKPIASKLKRYVLKRNSLMFLCLWCLICIGVFILRKEFVTAVYISTLGVLWQSLTLTKTGHRLYTTIDKGLNYLI